MTDEEKLLWLFNEIHGNVSPWCYLEVTLDEQSNPERVNVMKDGDICWYNTKVDLVFNYITRNL